LLLTRAVSIVIVFPDGTTLTQKTTWVGDSCAKMCSAAGFTNYITCACELVESTGRRLLATSDQVILSVPTAQVGSADAAAAAKAAESLTVGGVTPVSVAGANKVSSNSPTAAPTPVPTVSWQSRLLFWIWLTQFLSGVSGWFGL